MNVELGIAGLICLAMAVGHATIGLVWVLPTITEARLQGSPFGPSSMTLAMVRITWHIVTIFLVAFGGLLTSFAWAPAADARMLLLRWFAPMWLAATAMAYWVSRRRPLQFLRLPVPLLWVVVGLLCWTASR